jgi:phage recombination protein Bet
MSANLVAIMQPQVQAAQNTWTEAEVQEVKHLIARDAKDEEFKLFIYTAKQRGLNPLLKQIYCIHRGGRMTIQTSIDGYRLIANRTGKLAGIERGVKRDQNGKLTHGWARVWRKDWQEPAYEEASFAEYSTGYDNWYRMPETMIKKVAEAAALRMAFPEDLSGIYTSEEMDQADRYEPVRQQTIKTRLQEQEKVEVLDDQIKAILHQIKHLMNQYGLSPDEVATVTGIDSFKGITDKKVLESALTSVLDYAKSKLKTKEAKAEELVETNDSTVIPEVSSEIGNEPLKGKSLKTEPAQTKKTSKRAGTKLS